MNRIVGTPTARQLQRRAFDAKRKAAELAKCDAHVAARTKHKAAEYNRAMRAMQAHARKLETR